MVITMMVVDVFKEAVQGGRDELKGDDARGVDGVPIYLGVDGSDHSRKDGKSVHLGYQ